MAKELITKTKFAAIAKIDASTVTKACAGALKAAVVGKRIDLSHECVQEYLKGKNLPTAPIAPGLDPLYELAIEFCKTLKKPSGRKLKDHFKIGSARAEKLLRMIRMGGALELPPVVIKEPKKTIKETKKTRPLNLDPERDLLSVPEDIRAYADMSLKELIRRFGTDTAFCDWLGATQTIERINGDTLKNAKLSGELISRKMVKERLFGTVDELFTKLLGGAVRTMEIRTRAMHMAGEKDIKVEKYLHDHMGKLIKECKNKMAKGMRKL